MEAFADGWWHTAGLAEGLRLFACMTDYDIGRRLGLTNQATWMRCMETRTKVAPFTDGQTQSRHRTHPMPTVGGDAREALRGGWLVLTNASVAARNPDTCSADRRGSDDVAAE
jgi:hypothetical protein